jgi:hypothetical protein
MHAGLQFAANNTDINSAVKGKTPTPKQYYDFFLLLTFKIYELSLYTSDVTASEVSEMKNPPTADQTRPDCRGRPF